MFCAYKAAQRGRSVLLIEKNPKIGEKIRISGGGRCNFTNLYAQPENYISQNPHFCKSALSCFSPHNFIALVKKHGILFHEKNVHKDVHGQLFCDDSSQQIIEMLVALVRQNGGEILVDCEIKSIEKPDEFILQTSNSEFICTSLVIATGGLSIPKMGASDFGFRIAKQFGIDIITPEPALVPLKLDGKDLEFCQSLSGVSIDSVVNCNGVSFRENILFTHRGLSGPAILQISSYWNKGDAITINLLPENDVLELLKAKQNGKSQLSTVLSKLFPKRFVGLWLERFPCEKILAECKKIELEEIADHLHNFTLIPSDSEGYAKAEVTRGGINTNELSSKTMESKKVKGLYFIGEVVDVTGWLGGYNFQWAWASGNSAGMYV